MAMLQLALTAMSHEATYPGRSSDRQAYHVDAAAQSGSTICPCDIFQPDCLQSGFKLVKSLLISEGNWGHSVLITNMFDKLCNGACRAKVLQESDMAMHDLHCNISLCQGCLQTAKLGIFWEASGKTA